MSGKPLCELEWFRDNSLYRRVYDVLSVENALPDPCEVLVLETPPPGADESALAGCLADRRTVWFRSQPPPPAVFAHELVHLIEGKEPELEEVYAYNLSSLVVLLAERDITPPANPVRIYRDTTLNTVLEAVRRAYKYPFTSLREYFEFIGVLPEFLNHFEERPATILAITEIISGAKYDKLMFNTVIELLKIIKERQALSKAQ